MSLILERYNMHINNSIRPIQSVNGVSGSQPAKGGKNHNSAAADYCVALTTRVAGFLLSVGAMWAIVTSGIDDDLGMIPVDLALSVAGPVQEYVQEGCKKCKNEEKTYPNKKLQHHIGQAALATLKGFLPFVAELACDAAFGINKEAEPMYNTTETLLNNCTAIRLEDPNPYSCEHRDLGYTAALVDTVAGASGIFEILSYIQSQTWGEYKARAISNGVGVVVTQALASTAGGAVTPTLSAAA